MSRVLVGVPTQEMARKAVFYDYWNLLEKPEGTVCTFARGQSPARGRNMMIDQARENNCTHILFIDDDTIFPKDMLTRLLAHDKDVVSGLYLMRNFPHQPIIFDEAHEDGRCKNHFPQGDGLIEIVNCGLGAVLINMRVFESLEKPYIRLGETEPDHWGDDIGFFNRVRKAGFKLYCDLSVQVGHIATVTIYPAFKDGKWYVEYDTDGPSRVVFPAISPWNQ